MRVHAGACGAVGRACGCMRGGGACMQAIVQLALWCKACVYVAREAAYVSWGQADSRARARSWYCMSI
eukprot:365083-Chlamydomonas_euryale.AAC.28